MTPAQEAILGWLLRDVAGVEGRKETLKGVGLHAYVRARPDGREAARAAKDAAVAEARRLMGAT